MAIPMLVDILLEDLNKQLRLVEQQKMINSFIIFLLDQTMGNV